MSPRFETQLNNVVLMLWDVVDKNPRDEFQVVGVLIFLFVC